MNRYAILFLVTILTSGCVSTKNTPITSEATTEIRGKELTTSTRSKPDFAAMTAGKAMFAVLGAAAMISAGNSIVQENDVDDPAVYIGHQLASDIQTKYGVSISSENSPIVSGSDISDILKQPINSPYLLDVQTINWSFLYFPTNWNHYDIMYSAKIRLINTDAKTVVAEGFCAKKPEEKDDSPTYDQLLANKASVLKLQLKAAADFCINEFKSKVLSL